MKLTKAIRQSFVRAVLDDVPQVDYKEKARKLIQDHFVSLMPPAIKKIYANRELREEYLHKDYVHYYFFTAQVFMGHSQDLKGNIIEHTLKELREAEKEQEKQYDELESKLEGIARSFTTTQKLIEQFPEFEKYLPTEAEQLKNIPAVAEVIPALMAAGWPKK